MDADNHDFPMTVESRLVFVVADVSARDRALRELIRCRVGPVLGSSGAASRCRVRRSPRPGSALRVPARRARAVSSELHL